MKEKRPWTSEKMIYEFCHNSSSYFLKKVRHQDIRKQKIKDINKCYSALYIYGAAWHPLLTKLEKESVERFSPQFNLFPK